MKFLNHLQELAAAPEGNYIGLSAKFLNPFEGLVPNTGVPVEKDKLHTTLMYSKTTSVDPDLIAQYLNRFHPNNHYAIAHEAEMFDVIPKEGERDENKGTVVLKLKSDSLDKAHEDLKMLGLQHNYPEFKPHVSLYYGIDRDEGRQIVDHINSSGKLPIRVDLNTIRSEPIKSNFSKTLVKNAE